MTKPKITLKMLKTLQSQALAEKRALLVWDDSLRAVGHKGSFGVRVSPHGHSWQVQRWQGGRGGKAQRHSFEASTPDEARQIAVTLTADAAKGADLPQRAKEQREVKRKAVNASKLGEAAALYIKRKRKPGRYWDEVELRFNNEIIPALGKDTRIPKITKGELRVMINAKLDADQPAGARLLYAALRPFFRWCIDEDIIQHSPLEGIPAPKPLDARTRTLTEAELKAFWNATPSDPLYGPFYRLLLLTMQRREEVGGMQWSELDLGKALWTIPGERTKNGHAHLVPLSPQAMAVIESVKAVDGCPYVFGVPARNGNGWSPVSAYSDAKERLDKLMPGVAPWRVHDLRRTGRTALAKLKVPREVAEKILNHVPKDKLEAVYNLHEYLDERAHALTSWGLQLDRVLGNFVPDNVRKLRA